MPLSGIIMTDVKTFKTRSFQRWQRKAGLTDQQLCQAVSEMAKGLIDADLGGNVLKKRIALRGRGKRGGARTLVVTNKNNRWFFVYGFAKNERSNIRSDERDGLRKLAADLLGRTDEQLVEAVAQRVLQEVGSDS